MNMQPIPQEVMQECRRLIRMHYGYQREPDAALLASVWARGIEHGRTLEKAELHDEIEEYEAERREWDAEKASIPDPITIDLSLRLPDEVIEQWKERFLAAVRSGTGPKVLEPANMPEFTPIQKIRDEGAQKERDEIAAHINEELNKTRPQFDDVIAAYESVIDWLDKRNDDANRERRTEDNDAVREPGGAG